jgi:NodT family efflux transporter outer membrane factor (OMF) lipoprotein
MRKLLPAILVPLLAGCSVGPDYQRPATPEPAAWQGPAGAAWPGLDWWQGFQSPHLQDLLDDARKTNFDLGAAAARVRQADAQVRIAGGALLPSVGFAGGPTRSRSLPATKSGAAPQGVNTFSGVFTASYELDFWGRNADAVAAAQATAQGLRYDQETTALTVEANVASTYFTALALRDRLAAAKGNVVVAEHTLDAIRARLDVGTASALDLAQQESVVAEQKALIPPLLQGYKQNTYALAILVGKLPEELHLDDEGLDAITLPAVAPGLPSELLARRPDVRSAEAQLIAANATIKEATAAIFPSLTLTAQGGAESYALSKLLEPHSTLYLLGASLAQPIFEGGVLEGGIELEKARWDELTQDYQKAVVSAFADVESELVAVEQGRAQEEAERVSVDTARRAYQIVQAQLFSGTVDIVTVLNTQRALFQAEDLLFQARLAHAQAVVGLFRALGGGWQDQPVRS